MNPRGHPHGTSRGLDLQQPDARRLVLLLGRQYVGTTQPPPVAEGISSASMRKKQRLSLSAPTSIPYWRSGLVEGGEPLRFCLCDEWSGPFAETSWRRRCEAQTPTE